MAYDPNTVIRRYQQMLDIAEEEPTSLCALLGEGKASPDPIACEPGGCQSCCVGVVELIRQYNDARACIDTRSIEFDDTLTKAEKLKPK